MNLGFVLPQSEIKDDESFHQVRSVIIHNRYPVLLVGFEPTACERLKFDGLPLPKGADGATPDTNSYQPEGMGAARAEVQRPDKSSSAVYVKFLIHLYII